MTDLEKVKVIVAALAHYKESDSDYDRGVYDAYNHVLEIINAHLEDNNDSK